MTPLRIRHYTPAQRSEAENATGLALARLVASHAPRFATLDLALDLELIPCEDPTFRNRVTFVILEENPEIGTREKEYALEDLLGLETVMTPGIPHRSLVYEGQTYGAIPSGLLADGLLRVTMTLMGETCGGSCSGCNGCGHH